MRSGEVVLCTSVTRVQWEGLNQGEKEIELKADEEKEYTHSGMLILMDGKREFEKKGNIPQKGFMYAYTHTSLPPSRVQVTGMTASEGMSIEERRRKHPYVHPYSNSPFLEFIFFGNMPILTSHLRTEKIRVFGLWPEAKCSSTSPTSRYQCHLSVSSRDSTL